MRMSRKRCKIRGKLLLITDRKTCMTETQTERYGDGAGNTVEENSSVFSLIRMR